MLRRRSRPSTASKPATTLLDINSASKSQLDALAQQLVQTVNTIHRTGWTAAGDALGGSNWDPATPPTGSNVDFFDPANISAANITLSAQVRADASYIAAGNVQNGTGNTAITAQMAQLRTVPSIVKDGSTTQTIAFGEYYRDLTTKIGIATDDSDRSATIYETLANSANARRISESGVSTDEELISLVKYQQAYAAAAKVINAADEMAQVILDMVR